jgi:hypothetical protein
VPRRPGPWPRFPWPPFPWPWQQQPPFWWTRTWYAPCNDLSPGVEWSSIQVRKGTVNRLISVAVQPPKNGNAMRAEVLDGDVAWNPKANGGKGAEIPSGWRAEAVGPTEYSSDSDVRYDWSTMLDPNYVNDPRIAAGNDAGKRTWQVITQWHQGDHDQGASPPIAFTIVGDNIRLHLDKHDPADQDNSIEVGQWPVATLDRGTWHDFRAEIRWHLTDGSIKVWHNGQRQTFQPQPQPGGEPPYPRKATDTLTGLETLFPPKTGSAEAPSAYLKAGLYRRGDATIPPGPYVLFHDEFSRYTEGFLRRILVAVVRLIKRIRLPRRFRWPPPSPPWPPFLGGRRRTPGPQ